VLLVTPGETEWEPNGWLQGWAPTRLTDRGETQVAAAAETVAARDPDRLVSSDVHRGLRTARAVEAATGLEPVPDRAWRAHDFGFLQGFDAEDAFERFPRFSVARRGEAALTERPDGGESLRDTRRRALEAFARLATDLAAGETVVVVTHETPLWAVRCSVEGGSFVETVLSDPFPPASVTTVAVEGDERRVVGTESPSP
jgi:probable phosphoglycerate mutase